jgi:DmsE family decaheme c-type cytochrome
MRFSHSIAAALAGGAALLCAQVAFAQQPAETKSARADLVLTGDARCTRCHDAEDSPQLLAIGQTRHGTTADGRTPTCTNCHGESENHVNRPGGSKERPKPDRTFGKTSTTPMAERSAACLTCHQGGNRIAFQASVHANRDVACSSCHKIHSARDAVRDTGPQASRDSARDVRTQTDVCFTCHKEQRAQVNRPVHHPIIEGKMTCSSCHNVHGDNPAQLVKDSVNETCFTCHMEKRGPFLHNHQPVQENCAICHQPHGTVIANLLKARPPFLCQECHSHTSHPSQAAGLPTGRTTSTSLLGTVARGCPNCHINIHGSNSSQNSATAGRFRR